MSKPPIIEVKDLRIWYRLREGDVKAVDKIEHLEIREGEIYGLVGESGCGKSTFAFGLMRLVPPPGEIVSGKIYFRGENILDLPEEEFRRYRWKNIAMVFQAAMNSLNPVMTVGDQVAEAIMLHMRVSYEEALEMVKELFRSVGLDPVRIKDYPHHLSGGMRQRVVIAMAIALKPDLVILDEPTTALDVTIQAQILELLKTIIQKYKMSALFITHDIALEAEFADRIGVMYAGEIVEEADVFGIFERPIHPYSKGLFASVPTVDRAKERKLVSIPGTPPDLIRPPQGCRFAPRCPYRKPICEREHPEMRVVAGHRVRCHFAEELVDVPPEKLWAGYLY